MKLSAEARSRWIIYITFAVALVLAVMPMPEWARGFRPDWVALTLIYWCMATPQRVGVGTGWVAGLLLDVLFGAMLGQHALANSVTAYLTVRLHLQLRMFPMVQQALSVLALLALNQFIVIWMQSLAGHKPETLAYITPLVVGAVIWPWLFVILRDVRRRSHVS
jgi:rod shape-determining protein MreD